MEAKILDALKEAKRPGQVVDATGLERADVDKTIKKLVKEGKVHSPKRCFYQVKE